MEKIVEDAVKALNIVTTETHSGALNLQQVAVPKFVQFLLNNIKNIEHVVTNVLWELAVDKESNDITEQENPMDPLPEILRSRNEGRIGRLIIVLPKFKIVSNFSFFFFCSLVL